MLISGREGTEKMAEAMRGRVGRWAGNKEPDELSLQLGILWRVWVSTEHFPQLEPRTPGTLNTPALLGHLFSEVNHERNVFAG